MARASRPALAALLSVAAAAAPDAAVASAAAPAVVAAPAVPPIPIRATAPVRYVRITSASPSLNLAEVEVLTFAGVNVALGRPATQSSTDRDVDVLCGGATIDAASAAVDGNTCTFQSTAGGFNDWWEVDLGSPRTDLALLRVLPRFDDKYGATFAFRADGAAVALLDGARGVQATLALPAAFGASSPTPFVADLCRALAPAVRFVRVTAAGPEALNFGELGLVARGGDNAARGKPASQSSLYRETEAFCGGVVVDVAAAGVDGDPCTFVATNVGRGDWWEVDLQEARGDLQTLEFYIRDEDRYGKTAAYRANGANVTFYDRAHGLMGWLQLPKDVASLPVPWRTDLDDVLARDAGA